MKKHFKKELIRSKENARHFRKANKCHINSRLCFQGDNKVRDHFDITDKYRSSALQLCHSNYKLPQKYLSFFIVFKDILAIKCKKLLCLIKKCCTNWNGKIYDF